MRDKPEREKTRDLNLMVRSDGTVFPEEVCLDDVRKVTFHPEGPRHVITVKFVDRVPFRDWECSVRTADLVETLSGRIRRHAQDDYKFRVFSHQIATRKETDGQPKADC